MELIILGATFFGFLILGVPVAFAIGLAAICTILYEGLPVAVIFQPAEEGGGGGREMVNDGMMDRFGIQEVYGVHNAPGLPVGKFALRAGPLMAAADRIEERGKTSRLGITLANLLRGS